MQQTETAPVTRKRITIRGGGIVGLWQAYVLAKRGHEVRLVERSEKPFSQSASWLAGAMLAPFCEGETAEPLVRELGLRSLALWRETFPQGVVQKGSLVVASARDQRELDRFARMTEGHEWVDADQIAKLEPDLAGRFSRGLFFPQEAHLQPHWAMMTMMQKAEAAGAAFSFGQSELPEARGADEIQLDCRGIDARDALPELRAVRGEMAILETAEITLSRPVRLLHPRFPLYVVPWPENYFMVGATLVESDDRGPVTVRSLLELLGTAYAIHPAFGEAHVAKTDSHLRPAFPDNTPKILQRDGIYYVNGLYRHGFLTAPALAERFADFLETGVKPEGIFS